VFVDRIVDGSGARELLEHLFVSVIAKLSEVLGDEVEVAIGVPGRSREFPGYPRLGTPVGGPCCECPSHSGLE